MSDLWHLRHQQQHTHTRALRHTPVSCVAAGRGRCVSRRSSSGAAVSVCGDEKKSVRVDSSPCCRAAAAPVLCRGRCPSGSSCSVPRGRRGSIRLLSWKLLLMDIWWTEELSVARSWCRSRGDQTCFTALVQILQPQRVEGLFTVSPKKNPFYCSCSSETNLLIIIKNRQWQSCTFWLWTKTNHMNSHCELNTFIIIETTEI